MSKNSISGKICAAFIVMIILSIMCKCGMKDAIEDTDEGNKQICPNSVCG